MMAELAVHVKELDDETFLSFFPAIEREATDSRNFVKKGVNWCLRQIGKRNVNLHKEALAFAKKLSTHNNATARWIGKDAVKDLLSDPVKRKLQRMKET